MEIKYDTRNNQHVITYESDSGLRLILVPTDRAREVVSLLRQSMGSNDEDPDKIEEQLDCARHELSQYQEMCESQAQALDNLKASFQEVQASNQALHEKLQAKSQEQQQIESVRRSCAAKIEDARKHLEHERQVRNQSLVLQEELRRERDAAKQDAEDALEERAQAVAQQEKAQACTDYGLIERTKKSQYDAAEARHDLRAARECLMKIGEVINEYGEMNQPGGAGK